MKFKLLISFTTLGLLLVAAAVVGAASTQAAAKPGFLPGTWHGTGTISGSIKDDVGTTTFSGKIGFRLTVRKDLSVRGNGSWVKKMKGRGIVSSTMTGIGFLQPFGGIATDVRFGYTEAVEGTVTANGITRPVAFERVGDDLEGRLVITRARKCTVVGTVPTGEGATIKWTAKRLGNCSE